MPQYAIVWALAMRNEGVWMDSTAGLMSFRPVRRGATIRHCLAPAAA